MQNKSRLNQRGGNRLLERWQYVASVWQCVALEEEKQKNDDMDSLKFLSLQNENRTNPIAVQQ